MEWDEVVLRVVGIVVTVLAILLGVLIALWISERKWRKEKRERLGSDILAPLIEEVESNVSHVKSGKEWYRHEMSVREWVRTDTWGRVRYDLLWRFFADKRRKVGGQVGRWFENLSLYGEKKDEADYRFRVIVRKSLVRQVFVSDFEDSGMESVLCDDMRGLFDGLKFMMLRAEKRRRGNVVGYEMGDWSDVVKEYAGDLDAFVRKYREEDGYVKDVKGEEVLILIGNEIWKDQVMISFRVLWNRVVSNGEKLLDVLSWEEKVLRDKLYKKVDV